MSYKTASDTENLCQVSLPKEYNELVEIWSNQPYVAAPVNYQQLSFQNPVLFHVLNHAPCVSWILNLRTQQYEFISSNTQELLGYDACLFTENGLPFMTEITHPEDLPETWRLIRSIWRYLMALPLEERAAYKLNYDYRIVKPDRSYARILEQSSVLQLDEEGNITHILGMDIDITHWKKSDSQLASIVSAAQETCLLFTPEAGLSKPNEVLSKRELQILKLLSEGHSSKLIANQLCISFHTVNTHRQKMIEKTNSRNTGGLVQFAMSNGLI